MYEERILFVNEITNHFDDIQRIYEFTACMLFCASSCIVSILTTCEI